MIEHEDTRRYRWYWAQKRLSYFSYLFGNISNGSANRCDYADVNYCINIIKLEFMILPSYYFTIIKRPLVYNCC